MRARKNLGFLEKIFQGFLDFIISVYKEDQTKIPTQKERRIHHSLSHFLNRNYNKTHNSDMKFNIICIKFHTKNI